MALDDPNATSSASSAAAASSVTTIPKPSKPSPPPAAVPPQLPPQIQDFDALINSDVQNFVKLGDKIGGLVAEQVRLSGTSDLYPQLLTLIHSPKQSCKLFKLSAPTFTCRQRLKSLNPNPQSL